jgi:hypothetical protein
MPNGYLHPETSATRAEAPCFYIGFTANDLPGEKAPFSLKQHCFFAALLFFADYLDADPMRCNFMKKNSRRLGYTDSIKEWGKRS